MRSLFAKALPTGEVNYQVFLRNMGQDAQPAVVTRMEWMRRMKEMSQYQPGASFYNSLPDSYSLVLNADHPLIKSLLEGEGKELEPQLASLRSQLATLQEQVTELDKEAKEQTEPTEEQKKELQERKEALHKLQEELHGEMQSSFDQYAEKQPMIRHIVELALLSAGELRGVALQEFIKRTTELLSSK